MSAVDLRCALWTKDQGIDPVGSAVRVDTLVAVEIPLPWPADVADVDWLAGVPVPDGTRLQAIVPETPRLDGSVLVTRWTQAGAGYRGEDWLVAATQVRDTLVALVAGETPPGSAPAPEEVLVCGHGTRDRCCGGFGTRLAVEARASLPGIRIRRTSHLGGHRYAPTAIHLPDGRVWAYLDADSLGGIVTRTLDPVLARSHYRGASFLEPLAQVVEADELTRRGWAAFTAIDIEADIVMDGSDTEVTLRWDGPDGAGQRHAEVGIRREYPVLVCGEPPETATKTAQEYEIR